LPPFIAEPDFVSLLDFMSLLDDFVSLDELAAGDDDFVSVLLEVEPDVLVEPVAPEDLVSVLELAAGGFLSLLLGPLVLLWANADVASIAPATVSAKALIHVFITVLLIPVC
jgi:hypothetical protein